MSLSSLATLLFALIFAVGMDGTATAQAPADLAERPIEAPRAQAPVAPVNDPAGVTPAPTNDAPAVSRPMSFTAIAGTLLGAALLIGFLGVVALPRDRHYAH